MISTNTYLIFDGNCRQAMAFYKKCLGGELHQMTYAEVPGGTPGLSKECKDWIIHARLTIKSAVLMASDTRPGLPVAQGNNFFVNINCESDEEAQKLFKAFSEKAEIDMALQETFFAARFGMLTDQFGIKWMFIFEKSQK